MLQQCRPKNVRGNLFWRRDRNLLQTGIVKQTLAAGKPVLTEKPLGRHLSEIDDCFENAKAAETPLFVAFQRRFDPVPSPDYIKISGGIFHDCMVHDLDMVCHIAGEYPTHMTAFGSSFIPEIGQFDDYDNVVATLSFASGVQATIDINRKSVYGYDQRLEAFGSEGMLQVENYHNTSPRSYRSLKQVSNNATRTCTIRRKATLCFLSSATALISN